jgi:hypothetical protein
MYCLSKNKGIKTKHKHYEILKKKYNWSIKLIFKLEMYKSRKNDVWVYLKITLKIEVGTVPREL